MPLTGFENPQNFKWFFWFLPLFARMILKKALQKKWLPPKKTWQKTTRPAKIILKQQNPSKSSTFKNFAFHLLWGFSYPPRLACELSSGEVISLRGQTFDLCALCREVPLGFRWSLSRNGWFFFSSSAHRVFFGFPNPPGKRALGKPRTPVTIRCEFLCWGRERFFGSFVCTFLKNGCFNF